MASLQNRLNLNLGLTLALLMLSIWWLSSNAFTHISEKMIHSRLEHDGEALLAALQLTSPNRWQLKDSQVGHIYQRIFSGHYYQIQIGDQQLRSRSLWDQLLNAANSSHIPGPDRQQLLVWRGEFLLNQQTVHISVAEDISPIHESVQHYSMLYAAACALALLILLLTQRWLITRSFRSLNQLSDELEALASGEKKQLSLQVPSEVKPLVNEVNRLLELLHQRLQRSRNAMGNLAHSLKHPLNLLMQLPSQQTLPQDIQQQLQQYTRQIQHLMDRELKRARLAGAGLPGQQFDAEQELPLLIDVLKRVYQDKPLHFELQLDCHQLIHADRNDMLELLGNLLDNACKWSHSTIRCHIDYRQGMRVQIEDDGPGCSDAKRDQLTQRGVRADENTPGSGLGLAIVKDIVELYQGSLELDRSALGGLNVTVRLAV